METPWMHHNPNPVVETNCLSKISFWWIHGIIRKALKGPLQEADIYDVLPEDSSIQLSNDLGREWEKEVYKSKTGGRPSLFKALFRSYGLWVIGAGLLFFFEECFRITQAIFLGLLLSYFEENSQTDVKTAYFYATGWSLAFILVILFDNIGFHKSLYFGLKMRVACTSLIYRKILKLSQYSLKEIDNSRIVTLMSSDAHRFDQSCLGINYLWIGPLQTVVIIAILWKHLDLGATCLIGVAFVLILAPIQFFMGRRMSKLRSQMSHLTDRRIQVISEVISGMRTIKINCWEKPFANLINTLRRSEWNYLKNISHIRGINSAIYFSAGKLLMAGTFITLTVTGFVTNARTIYTTLALYEILRTSVSLLLPWGVQFFTEAFDSMKNIQEFLLMEERRVHDIYSQNSLEKPPLAENVIILFEDYTASWCKNILTPALENLNFTIQKGQLVTIIGPTDSGKSSLLMSILGEIPRIGGTVTTRGRLAYVPQHSWVFQGTVRENILFGLKYNEARYEKVITVCQLNEDLLTFFKGDLSIIGTKELVLTLGQKAKICLARAVYYQADIYLIDDILSSFDEKTAFQIFKRGFCDFLSAKTILIVTKNMTFVRTADQVIAVKDAKLHAMGSYEDLKNSEIKFSELLLDYFPLDNSLNIIKEDFTQTPRYKLDLDNSELINPDILFECKEETESEADLTTPQILNISEDVPETAPLSVYKDYFKIGGGSCGLWIFGTLCLLSQLLYVLADWWLFKWSTGSELTSQSNETTAIPLVEKHINMDFYLYMAFLSTFFLVSFFRPVVFSLISVRASKRLHDNSFNALLGATLSFFETNSSATILNRFSRDLSQVDDPLPASLFDSIQFFGLGLGAIIVAGISNYWMLIAVLLILPFILLIRRCYTEAAKEIRGLEYAGRKPVYHHISNTLEGLWTIRAFVNEERFLRHFDHYQDCHTSASYLNLSVNRWLGIRLDFLSFIFVALLAFTAVVVKHTVVDISVNSSLLGLALAYTLNLMGMFQYSIRQFSEVESQMTSVERIGDYMYLDSEAEPVSLTTLPALWPQYGIVTFEGATLMPSIDGCGGNLLKNVWCCIRSQESIGVLGKPDSSKRALISAILRLAEHKGSIRIDGLEISEIGLHDLRKSVTVITQDPVMFGGNIRRNLDPYTKYPDAQIWRALSDVQMKDRIEKLSGNIYAESLHFGSYFTTGQRQLLGLARALLTGSKIVIFEESQSILDKRSELLISHILRTKFENKTLIVIAHRIKTVIDLDRVMIIENGRVKDNDSAHLLLENRNSLLYKMVQHFPNKDIHEMEHIAKEKHDNKPYTPPPQCLGGWIGTSVGGENRGFLPSFQNNRLSGVLNPFTANRFSTNRF